MWNEILSFGFFFVTGVTLGEVCRSQFYHRNLPPWWTPSTSQSSEQQVSSAPTWLPSFSYPSPFSPTAALPCSENYRHDQNTAVMRSLNAERERQASFYDHTQFSLLWDSRRNHRTHHHHPSDCSSRRSTNASDNQLEHQSGGRRVAATKASNNLETTQSPATKNTPPNSIAHTGIAAAYWS